MFDLNQRKFISKPKVKDLLAVLEGENPEAILTVDGLDEFYIHVTEDNNHVGIDMCSLEEDYVSDYENKNIEFPVDISEDTQKEFKIEYGLSRLDCLDLLNKVIKDIPEKCLTNKYQFNQEQIRWIKGD